MANKVKAQDYTRSVWSGEKYERPQTQAELTSESMKVLNSHPTASRAMKCDDEMMRRLFGDAFKS